MIVAICILIAAIAIPWAIYLNLTKLTKVLNELNPEQTAKWYFDTQTVEEYPCTLLIRMVNGATADFMSYDFSSYEKNGIIGLTDFRANNETAEIQPFLLMEQVVCKMKDGSYQWDIRHML